MKPIKFIATVRRGMYGDYLLPTGNELSGFVDDTPVRVTMRERKTPRKLTDRQKQIIHDVIMAILGAGVAIAAAILW